MCGARCRRHSRSGCLGGRAHAAACAPTTHDGQLEGRGAHAGGQPVAARAQGTAMSPTARTCRAGSALRRAACSSATSAMRGGGRRARSHLGALRGDARRRALGRPGASSASSSCGSSRSAAGSTGSPSASRARGSKRPPGAFGPHVLTIESRGTPRRTKRIGRGCRMKRCRECSPQLVSVSRWRRTGMMVYARSLRWCSSLSHPRVTQRFQ